MASARIVGRDWYFLPPYVLAIPPAVVWLSRTRTAGAIVAAVLVAVAVIPQAVHAREPARPAAREEHVAGAVQRFVAGRVGPGQIALTPPEYALPDTRYFELVQMYDVYAGDLSFHALPATAAAAAFAASRGLRPVLAVGDVVYPGRVSFGGAAFRAERIMTGGEPFAAARLRR